METTPPDAVQVETLAHPPPDRTTPRPIFPRKQESTLAVSFTPPQAGIHCSTVLRNLRRGFAQGKQAE